MNTMSEQAGLTEKLKGNARGIYRFYRDGFSSMVLGKTLWKIIFIKLIIMFGVLKIFFFPNFLSTTFETDTERTFHVLDEITKQ